MTYARLVRSGLSHPTGHSGTAPMVVRSLLRHLAHLQGGREVTAARCLLLKTPTLYKKGTTIFAPPWTASAGGGHRWRAAWLPAILVAALLPGAARATTEPSGAPGEPAAQAPSAVPAAGVSEPQLQRHLDAAGAEGCFLLYNAAGEPFIRLNPGLAERRYTPASTFKIPNSLIALETGVLRDEHEIIPWDGRKRWLDKWNQDMDLASAYALSAVWFYQDVARRVGLERMAEWVAGIGYGNGEIGKTVDTFWLEGPLAISPEEQIGFLRRLYAGELPFSERTMRIVKQIMLFERGEGYAVRAKTGWAMRNGMNTGWYVGWIERDGGPWFFVLNIESEDEDFPMFEERRRILLEMLTDLNLIPKERPRGSRL